MRSPPSIPSPSRRSSRAGEGAAGRYVQGDATDEELVARTVSEAFDASARLDYLVNAAGVGWYDRDGSIADMEMAVWHQVMEINLTASALMARHSVPLLRRTGAGGSMVHIASVVGLRNMENILEGGPIDAYQASKAGLTALSRSLSMQLGPDGIRSNTICPGAVLTPMTAPTYEADPSRADAMIARTPLGRLGMPEDIAHACLFLLSDKAVLHHRHRPRGRWRYHGQALARTPRPGSRDQGCEQRAAQDRADNSEADVSR